MDTLDYLMTRSNVMPRLNSRVLGVTEKFLEFSDSACECFVVECFVVRRWLSQLFW